MAGGEGRVQAVVEGVGGQGVVETRVVVEVGGEGRGGVRGGLCVARSEVHAE